MLCISLLFSCTTTIEQPPQPAQESVSSSNSTQSSSSEIRIVEKGKVIGVSQKGPFTKGSAITLSELNDKLAQTGRSFEATITDDKGSFEIGIKDIELASPYVMLKANGYYRNEVSGKISTAPINLYAIADIREKSNINVNILTHLEYNRVQKLVEDGKSLKDAKKQAQKEILAVFGISGEFKDSEEMSIFGTTDDDAALLAISVLLQGDLTEGQFTERLADFNLGFKETGTWDSKTAKDAMANWAAGSNANYSSTGGSGDFCDYGPTPEYPNNCWPMPTEDMCETGKLVKSCSNSGNTSGTATSSLAKVRSNILGWNLSSAVPDFEKFVNNYWYVNYGLGNCDASLQNSIKSSNKKVDYICKDKAWAVATEYERDTYQLDCKEEGEIKEGKASGKKYICKSKTWVLASEGEILFGLCTKEGEVKSNTTTDGKKYTTYYICKNKNWSWASEYDYDIYQLGACSKDGEIKEGLASGQKYICKDKAWETPTEYELDTYQWVCTEGEIKAGQVSGTKYICKSKTWETANEYELDVGGLGSCSTEGEIKAGQVSGTKYICKSKVWAEAKYIDIKCSESKSCQTFKDARDEQSYYSVKIGEQTWMAENLNYNASGSICGGNNCATYGREYDWETAMKACPTGWHLPTNDDWDKLMRYVDNTTWGAEKPYYSETSATYLKATSGWDTGNGTDAYGFAALPDRNGVYNFWWSASEINADNASVFRIKDQYVHLGDGGSKSMNISVRCMKD